MNRRLSAPSFDPTALAEPVDKAAVREHARVLKQHGVPGFAGGTTAIIVIAFSVIAFALLFGSAALSTIGSIVSGGGGAAFVPVLPLFFLIVVIALVAWQVFGRGGLGAVAERRYRLDRFARANGMSYLPLLNDPGLPGMIFGKGGARRSSDLVRGDRPRFVEFGNYRYTTGSGKNRTTHRWGYVAVKLDVPLPHIVLDALGNNALFGSNLPASFDRDQRLRLEGDFDKYFALYCPQGYERDALYLFTPDIMARFIDNAAALDVEIVDDWLFLYAKREFSTLDPATWAWLFSVVGALLDKLAQWGRWRDDNLRADAAALAASTAPAVATGADVPAGAAASALPFAAPPQALRPPPGVAAEGRRLKRGVPVALIVVIALLVVSWLLSPMISVLGFLR